MTFSMGFSGAIGRDLRDHVGNALSDESRDARAVGRAVVLNVCAHALRGSEVTAGQRSALRAAELRLEPAGQVVPEVHGAVECVDVVGEGVAAERHRRDHAHHPAAAVLDLAERKAERDHPRCQRAARHAFEQRAAHEGGRSAVELIGGVELGEYGIRAMESPLLPVRVQLAVGRAALWRDDLLTAGCEALRAHRRCLAHDTDTWSGMRALPRMVRQSVVPCSARKRCRRSWPSSTTTGRPSAVSLRRCRSPISTSGAVTPPHSPPVLPIPPGRPAVSRTSQFASVSEASSMVCITVGAQWPMRSRLFMLRLRSCLGEIVGNAGRACRSGRSSHRPRVATSVVHRRRPSEIPSRVTGARPLRRG